MTASQQSAGSSLHIIDLPKQGSALSWWKTECWHWEFEKTSSPFFIEDLTKLLIVFSHKLTNPSFQLRFELNFFIHILPSFFRIQKLNNFQIFPSISALDFKIWSYFFFNFYLFNWELSRPAAHWPALTDSLLALTLAPNMFGLTGKMAPGEVGVWLPWWCPTLVLPAPGSWGLFLNLIIFS